MGKYNRIKIEVIEGETQPRWVTWLQVGLAVAGLIVAIVALL